MKQKETRCFDLTWLKTKQWFNEVSYIKLNNVIKLQCEWLILKYIKKSVIIRYLEYNYDSW